MFGFFLITAVCLSPPVAGPVSSLFAPVGQYEGHFGIDYSVPVGTDVLAPADGPVTFAGSVAGMKTITIEPVSNFKVSVSYLSEVLVAAGAIVVRGQVIARSGLPHQIPGVHLSTRIDGAYVDPLLQLGCVGTEISRALRLVTPPQLYPRTRAHRDTRRNFRSDSSRPSARRRNGSLSGRTRSTVVRAGWRSMAEKGSERDRAPPSGCDGRTGYCRRLGLRNRSA